MVEQSDETKFFERQLVVFNIGNEIFGVDISDVREIIKLETFTKIPETPTYVKGIINLRDKIVVVIDLAEKLDLKSGNDVDNKRIIITEMNGGTVGFIVDSCNEVVRLTGDKIQEAPAMIAKKIKSSFLQGVGSLNNRLLILIDLGAVIQDDDINNLSSQPSSDVKKKILLVEDSTMMRGTLKSYIDKNKYVVLEAGDGVEALSVFDKDAPGLIFLDIKMPKKDGISVLREIKSKSPNTRIIMETSVYEDKVKDECLSLGAEEYLKKPVSKVQIQKILDTY